MLCCFGSCAESSFALPASACAHFLDPGIGSFEGLVFVVNDIAIALHLEHRRAVAGRQAFDRFYRKQPVGVSFRPPRCPGSRTPVSGTRPRRAWRRAGRCRPGCGTGRAVLHNTGCRTRRSTPHRWSKLRESRRSRPSLRAKHNRCSRWARYSSGITAERLKSAGYLARI